MGFARTWTEELVGEWLTLKGYQVTAGVPVGSGVSRTGRRVGGRMEADILGAKVAGNTLEVQHIEVGVLAGSANTSSEIIRQKFAQVRQQGVKNFLEQSFGPGFSWDYQCRYIAVYMSRLQLGALPSRLLPIKLQAFDDFILQDVLPTLSRYTQSVRTVPDGLWLLGMLSYLHAKKLLA
jgi:hypothetical protein